MSILAFHNTNIRRQLGFNNYHPDRLKNLLVNLARADFSFASPDEYFDEEIKQLKICLTFDDGYDSFYKHVFPILDVLDITALVFIPTAYIGKRADWDYAGGIQNTMHLDEAQIREIAAAGHHIGSHGHSHISLARLPERRLKIELERSKKMLEDLTGREVKYISYPFGRFDEQVELAAAGYGYRKGFSLSHFKRSRYGFTAPRHCVYSIDTTYSVMKKLGRGGALNYIERLKGAIMNSYSAGTILLNKIRSQNSRSQV